MWGIYHIPPPYDIMRGARQADLETLIRAIAANLGYLQDYEQQLARWADDGGYVDTSTGTTASTKAA